MEMMAVIRGLQRLKRPTRVEVVTDSTYVGTGITQWLAKWKANGWRRRSRQGWEPIKNEDLWRELDRLLSKHQVTFRYVRGHSGHPENQRCDRLAVAAYKKYLGKAAQQ